jgi:uncharacterized protein (DUF2147 family)
MRTHGLIHLYALTALLALAPLVYADEPEQAVIGNWLVQTKDGIIGITRADNGTYQGTIVGGTDNSRLDSKNPDPAKRHNPLRGTVIMTGLHYAGHGDWTDGAVYDPDSGKSYKVRMHLVDDTHLTVRGFMGISLLGRNEQWTRYTGTTMDLPKPTG